LELPEERVNGVLTPGLHNFKPEKSQLDIVKEAVENPIGSPRLCELAAGKKKITVIASDHTRPVPSKIIMPVLLAEIRKNNPGADITILIATGCHRGTTREELNAKFPREIIENEKIAVHDCDDAGMLADIGELPSGGRLVINRLACEADLLVAEGFIEPHFFAGFSGGRKSVFPGIAGRGAVIGNHCSAFIADCHARTGITEKNPVHTDMLHAAKTAKLAFICNVVLNGEKEIIHAVAGDGVHAHETGCGFVSSLCKVPKVTSDIVIATNGGYPLDQNIYQAVKGMTAAEACVNNGGVIIMLAQSEDGHGGEAFYRTFKEERDLDVILGRILAAPAQETVPDQWQSQIFARVLKKARVIYVSDVPGGIVRGLHMIPAPDAMQALKIAESMTDSKKITVIPDGVSVIVT